MTTTTNKLIGTFLAGISTTVGFVTTAEAVTVNLHSSNVGIGSINVSVTGTTIVIEENWTSTGPGFLEFSDLELSVDYTIQKIITNNSGVDWSSFASELLDPIGDSNDTDDPLPYPSFVPAGFSTSNDEDGLSFAQGSGLPRTSTAFSGLVADEFTDARDFLDFINGNLGNGETDNFLTYGLRDNNTANENQPFLLSQRPNVLSRPTDPTPSVPEPASLIGLLGFSALGMSSISKRKRK
ncbi:MAG: PEP-CTERM sorting domain-containing protein [Cyanobacteria bacterium P01_G01_bin.49]